MGCSVVDIPQEVLQKIVLLATLDSPLGPPSELYSCLLTCWHFHAVFSPLSAGELYSTIFAHNFDSRAPTLRLSPTLVRENAPLELRRRFSALKIIKNLDLDHASLTEALWIAHIMVEESDASQKNVRQLLRVGLPSFLDLYLSRRLYEGADNNGGWPILNEQNSLAIALSWILVSKSSIDRDDRTTSDRMRDLLRPIVFAASRYSIFPTPEDLFSVSKNVETNETLLEAFTSLEPGDSQCLEVVYFGTVKKRGCLPSAPLFASLLYFARTESVTPFRIPKHITFKTHDEAILAGYDGLCIEDYEHYFHRCRTTFPDFWVPGLGKQLPVFFSQPDSILCAPARYELGTLSGQWQGSQMIPYINDYEKWMSGSNMKEVFNFDCECRTPVYFRIEEHYCCDQKEVVPIDDATNGMKNAWLPAGLTVNSTEEGMTFSDQNGTFHSTYHTYRDGQPLPKLQQVVDVIITGETPDRYTRWGGGSMVLGRVRLQDGLVVLMKYLPTPQHDPNHGAMTQLFRGYVTSSQNFVGKVKGSCTPYGDTASYEGIFSMNKAHDASQSYR